MGAIDSGLAGHGGPHVFVDDLETLSLDADDRHHLSRALRLRPGDALTASDGLGRWRSCRFGADLEPAGAVVETAAATPPLTVGFALVKGSKPELVVQKLTELGIDRIVPFTADRSVVQWDPDRAAKNLIRLRRVAREAAMQSHRAWLPRVEPLTSLAALAEIAGVVRADMAGEAPSAAHAVVLVGPEGGWTATERDQVPHSVCFGAHVMRAETAAIAVAALLSSARTGLIAFQTP